MARVVLLLLFTVLCSVLFAETALFDIQKKKAVVRSLGQCKGQRDLPLIFYGFNGRHDEQTGDMTATLKIKNKAEISNNLAIVFDFWKCDASGNPDSCEYVLKDHNVTDICSYMVAKDQMWSNFMEHFDKPMSCPIPPGDYVVKDFPINSDFMKYLPISDALWKVRLGGYDGGKKITCVSLVLQIVPFYIKRKS